MNYRPEIDGLRAIAIVPVVLFHAGFQHFGGGFVGVDVFFVISGYLITSLIMAEHVAGRFSLANFYERRARRILPALFCMMALSIPVAWLLMLPGEMKEFSGSMAAVPLFLSNLLFWKTSGYFDSAAELKPLLHTWSLAVEEQFYLGFPLLMIVIWKVRRRAVVLGFAALAAASLALACWGTARYPDAAFYLLPARVWELTVGALAAWYVAGRTAAPQWRMGDALSLAGLLLIAYAVFSFDSRTPFPGLHALIPVLGTALIIIFARPETRVGRLLGNRLFVGIGLISYSLYLWHQPVFAFARQFAEPDNLRLVLLTLLATGLGFLSWKYVEKPFRDPGRITRRQVRNYAAALSAVFITFGSAGVMSGGFAQRYPEEDRNLAALEFRKSGEYVQHRFNELAMREFDANDLRKRVLVIGDSYGQDLVNALHESGIMRDIQLSTRHIGKECGNLFIERARFEQYVDPASSHQCAARDLYADEKLRRLIRDADEIWLASAWQAWQVPLLPESIAALRTYSGKPVRLFGRKNFGSFRVKNLLEKDGDERLTMKVAISRETLALNAEMKATAAADSFIDVAALLCGDAATDCRLFTDQGDLISYDGSHLTPAGAAFLGRRLKQLDEIRRLTPEPARIYRAEAGRGVLRTRGEGDYRRPPAQLSE